MTKLQTIQWECSAAYKGHTGKNYPGDTHKRMAHDALEAHRLHRDLAAWIQGAEMVEDETDYYHGIKVAIHCIKRILNTPKE